MTAPGHPDVPLKPGEKYVGIVRVHSKEWRHVVLLSAEVMFLPRKSAMEWVHKKGGVFPSPEAYTLLICSGVAMIPSGYYWTKPYRYRISVKGDRAPAVWAPNGCIEHFHVKSECRVMAVRYVVIKENPWQQEPMEV